jgi:CHAD domain-containing protein
MITRERLNKFIRRRCHEIRHQVKEFCTSHDGEALHLLRVNIKKLRAMLALIEGCTSQHHLRDKRLKTVYRAAGVIRTAQINLKILHELDMEDEAFVARQQQLIDEGSLLFCLAAHQYQQSVHRVQEDLENCTADIKSQRIRTLFDERIHHLSLFFSAPVLDTVALHNTRKATKELMYMHAMLPAGLAASCCMNAVYLDQLQHKLGNWHDNAVTLSLLKSFEHTGPAILEKLQKTEGVLLDEIKGLTTGFDQKIRMIPGKGGGSAESGRIPLSQKAE